MTYHRILNMVLCVIQQDHVVYPFYVYVYMYHIFIHSSVYRHLGCFCILAIVNSANMNIGIHVTFELEFCLDNAQEWDC